MPILAVVRLPKKSLIPADAVENTFAFQTATDFASSTELDSVATVLTEFYNTAVGGVAVRQILSNSLSTSTGACDINMYDLVGTLSGTPHGSPVRISHFTLGATGTGTSLPDEVALCVSFHSAYGTDVEFGVGNRPRARDRGRIYLGPLASDLLSALPTVNEAVPDATSMTAIAGAAARLRDHSGTLSIPWCVWSRAAAALKPVVFGWVDNAFDTQRRRGNKATTRTTF